MIEVIFLNIGERIQTARKAAGLTQAQLAAKIGVVTGTVQQYELNKRQPRIEQLSKIADALDVPLEDLLVYSTGQTVNIGARIDPPDTSEEYRVNDTSANINLLRLFFMGAYKHLKFEDYQDITAVLRPFSKLNKSGRAEAINMVEWLAMKKSYKKEPEE